MLSIMARTSVLSSGTSLVKNSPSLCSSGIDTFTVIFRMSSTSLAVLASRMSFFMPPRNGAILKNIAQKRSVYGGTLLTPLMKSLSLSHQLNLMEPSGLVSLVSKQRKWETAK